MPKTNLSTLHNIYRIPRCHSLSHRIYCVLLTECCLLRLVSSKHIRCINMYKSNLKIKPSTAWVKPLVMSSVEHSNEITCEFKLLRWICLVIWENGVNYIKTTDTSLCTNAKTLMKHSIAVPWENVQLGCAWMHMELYAKGLRSTSMQIPWRIWIMRFYNYFYLSRKQFVKLMAYKHLPIDDWIVVFLSMYKLKQMCFIEVCLLNLVSWLKITS